MFSKIFSFSEQDSFELDLEDAIQPPPISISAPDLALLEYTTLHTFPMRRSVSSTELLYERAMARFYEAVELEEAEKARKLKISQDKIATPSNVAPATIRKRLGSMTEAERLSFEKRSELRRQSADIVAQDLKGLHKWSSKENIAALKPLSKTSPRLTTKRQESQESEEFSDDFHTKSAPCRGESYDLGSDYTESTASSDNDSIEKFRMELQARTRSPTPKELETYHPRNMSAGVFTPYRAPTPDEAALVLTRPVPLPSPDFVPKPILKRPSKENVLQADITSSTEKPENPNNDKLDIAKGIKSFFKRDKRTTTEKNTEVNEVISNPQEKSNAAVIAAEALARRKAKEEEEERKRKEAERLMLEEAHAAVDHYSELVQQVTKTKTYHTPLYMDQEGLKKFTSKAAKDDDEMSDNINLRRSHSPDLGLIPPVNNKPRLSISERGQLMHVRETASDLAVKREKLSAKSESEEQEPEPQPQTEPEPEIVNKAETKTEPITSGDREQPTAELDANGDDEVITTTTVLSETVEERPDSRGRPRLVKVKRIIKRRVPSSTRSRDTSLSRPPSSVAGQETATSSRTLSKTRRIAESKSPGPMGRKPLNTSSSNEDKPAISSSQELVVASSIITPLSDEEAHEKVRSALSYSTDMVLFIVACYVYLFKDARLVLPILALMIYRQLGEAINSLIPKWLRRKKQ